jgi:hypothetical protein
VLGTIFFSVNYTFYDYGYMDDTNFVRIYGERGELVYELLDSSGDAMLDYHIRKMRLSCEDVLISGIFYSPPMSIDDEKLYSWAKKLSEYKEEDLLRYFIEEVIPYE